MVRAEAIAQSKEMIASRIYALSKSFDGKKRIIVANVASLARFLPNPNLFLSNILKLKVGDSISINSLRKVLIEGGYHYVNKIDQSLQFAIRGDIIDVFSVNNDRPIRIELFGDEIESIREFDPVTQLSSNKIDTTEIFPASDIILSEEDIKLATDKIHTILEKDQHVLDMTSFQMLRDQVDDDITNILERNYSSRLYKYYSLLNSKRSSLLDYWSDATLVIVDQVSVKQSCEMLINDSMSLLREMHEQGRIISHLEMYQDIYKVISLSKNKVIKTNLLRKDNTDILFNVKNVPYQANKKEDIDNIIKAYLSKGYKVSICANNDEHVLLLTEMLTKENITYDYAHDFALVDNKQVTISLTNLASGFILDEDKIVYLTSAELFNDKVRVSRFDNRFKESTILRTHDDLEPGDFVVHEYQGIGQFIELVNLETDGIHRDYLKIAYSGDEILYVPLSQFQLVRKYLGKEGIKPRLSRLHTKDWENTKKRIKEKINDLANRLFNLYVERNKVVGYSFQSDDEYQKQFENECPFELTRDQVKAIEDIKKDMESTHPMDRLLCGDVGFGKTEVAFQAAFKAMLSGKQVAMLCPTTLLARQHYERAKERFAKFGVEIAVFSRLIPNNIQKENIKRIAEGKIHFVIGTHRLLSKDIAFKDLGLLIVDEEQRFGVEQKEKIKELKTNLDVLTLSATPIPRTLQISLLGVRSMSIINTPPKARMPIQTYVVPYSLDVCKELIERELGRHGQVYYLHNNVETLGATAAKLQRILPNVKIAIGHGQMERKEIEDVMESFYQGQIDVLVCTTIIENGIDIPNANLIIVDACENYGLSQLYQIKGRVGRSDRIAYAYLMYNENKILNEKAEKRLKAIEDFTELGSGYLIAQRDLLIRGAGDILGPDQAGYIDSIGLDMYLKLLNEAVEEKKEGKVVHKNVPKASLTLNIDAYIPSDYATDSNKIEMYQEIISVSNVESLIKLKNKIRDIYGKIPRSVELLFIKRNIDLLIDEIDAVEIKETPSTIELVLGDPYINIRGIGNIMFETLLNYISKIKVSYINSKFKIVINKNKAELEDLLGIVEGLKEIKDHNSVRVII